MCGFSVILGRKSFPSEIFAKEILDGLGHRGPDENGFLLTDDNAFFHTRLSILDLTDSSSQPIQDGSGRYTLVFNGEIYNYKRLAKEFLNDTDFEIRGDSQVLLRLLIKLGDKAINHLEGMFAFVFYDDLSKTTLIGRDRFGEKPLYYYEGNGFCVISSEIKSIRRISKHYDFQISRKSTALYFIVGSIPAPYTIYEQVTCLEPGSFGVKNDSQARFRITKYWSLKKKEIEEVGRSDALAHCYDLLQRSVNNCLVSDVPIGIFLSGGIDSSVLASLISKKKAGPECITLCVDFEEQQFSEFNFAQSVASNLGLEMHRSLVRKRDFIDSYEAFVSVMDQPTPDGFNTYFASKAAREIGRKVWISGVGGDEIFGGYPSFRRLTRLKKLNSILGSKYDLFPTSQSVSKRSLRAQRLISLLSSGDSSKRAYQVLRNPFPIRVYNSIVSEDWRIELSELFELIDSVYPSKDVELDDFQIASLFESSVYMSSQLLRDIDNFSMASSIEMRAPFLDHSLVEYVYSLPESMKYEAKKIKSFLVDSIIKNSGIKITGQQKRGFTFPMENWSFNRGDDLLDSRDRFQESIIDPKVLISVNSNRNTENIHWSTAWQINIFNDWIRENK